MENNIRKAWQILRLSFTVVPIVAGLDKFTNLLVQWDKYLSPSIQSILPVSAIIFMRCVGIIEIAAGIIVFKYTKIGSYIVSAWLLCIACTLLVGGFFDIAVRDIVMAMSAYVMALLTTEETGKKV